MSKKHISSTALALLLSIIFTLAGCSSRYPPQPKSEIKGKFVFYSLRDMKDSWSGYILKDRKITLLEKSIGCARWSPDGNFIAYVTNEGIVIYDDITKTKERIKISSRTGLLAWTSNGKSLIYVSKDGIYKKAHIRLYRYDIEASKHTLIKDFGIGHAILELSVSKDDKILFFDGLENDGIFMMDLNGENLKLLKKDAMHSNWFPDGKHIGYFTNTKEEGGLINDKRGIYFKMNIETGKATPLRELTSSDWNRKLSRDGKYLYYSKSYGKDGRYIVVSPLDKPDIEIPVTQPVGLGPDQGYSQDLDADWHQGE